MRMTLCKTAETKQVLKVKVEVSSRDKRKLSAVRIKKQTNKTNNNKEVTILVMLTPALSDTQECMYLESYMFL